MPHNVQADGVALKCVKHGTFVKYDGKVLRHVVNRIACDSARFKVIEVQTVNYATAIGHALKVQV